MTIDHRLMQLLVCPVCKGPLQLLRDEHNHAAELLCPADHLAFPIRDGIPAMLESEARHTAGDAGASTHTTGLPAL